MKKILPLDVRINELVNKKLSTCECNPCKCTDKEKDEYYQELKGILARYNMEIFMRYLYRDHFQKNANL